MLPRQTFAAACHQPAHWSAFHYRLERLAGNAPVQDWLIEQANLRGFFGAVLADIEWLLNDAIADAIVPPEFADTFPSARARVEALLARRSVRS